LSNVWDSTRVEHVAAYPQTLDQLKLLHSGSLLLGILKGEVSLYHWPPAWLVWNQLYDSWQFLFLFAKQSIPNQTGGQWYSDTSPFSIPWFNYLRLYHSIYQSNSIKSQASVFTYLQKSSKYNKNAPAYPRVKRLYRLSKYQAASLKRLEKDERNP
jgi:hypothetical protein